MAGIFGLLMSGAGVIKDQYYNLTSLLLPGNGTDGKQNRTFLDSSGQNGGSGWTITPNGNATQGTFSPFSQTGWSNYFGSSTANIVFASDASFGVGTGNFSVELSVNFNAWTGNQVLFLQGTSSLVGMYLDKPSSGNTLRFGDPNGIVISYAWTPNIGQWYNIAVVRAGTGTNQTTLYIDGVAVATGTSSASIPAYTAMVGGINYASPYNTQGYISNLRYSNVARTITNPTSFFTSDANTLLLTCRSNRFVDISGTPKTISQINGTTSVTPFSPFAPTQPYSAAAVGGSGYFDGTGDYLTVGYNANLQLGSSDFTIDFWFYSTGAQGAGDVLANGYTSGTNLNWLIQADVSTVKFYASTSGSTWAVSALTVGTIVHNQWNHYSITRSGTTVTPYLNGVAGTTGNLTGSVFANTSGIAIATDNSSPGTLNIQGYLSDFRIIIGSAVAPPSNGPTSPATAVTNTRLLLNFTNGGVIDATAKNVLETVGNAQISTTQSKWGGGSISFDGTGDYLKAPDDVNWDLGSSNFTIEAWVYPTASPLQPILIGQWTTSYAWLLTLSNDSNRYLRGILYNGSFNDYVSTSPLQLNSWNHCAMVRESNTVSLYLNGSRVYTTTFTGSVSTSTSAVTVGANASGADPFTGYMDDVRITKGLARYTGSTYTVPTAPFPVQ